MIGVRMGAKNGIDALARKTRLGQLTEKSCLKSGPRSALCPYFSSADCTLAHSASINWNLFLLDRHCRSILSIMAIDIRTWAARNRRHV